MQLFMLGHNNNKEGQNKQMIVVYGYACCQGSLMGLPYKVQYKLLH